MAKVPDRVSPKPQRPTEKSGTEIGDTSGIAVNGIIVNDDYNNKLVGREGVKIYNQMRLGDATVKAALEAIMMPILSAEWYVEAASEDKQDREIADFVEEELMNNGSKTWQETLQEVLNYLPFGRMPFEIIWEFRNDPQSDYPIIGLRKLARRDPSTIAKWKLDNGEPGVIQQTTNGRFQIPMDKMIVFVNRKEGDNWEGISVLRTAYKHWYIKDKLYLIDAISAERQGLGVPKGRVKNGASGTKEKLEEILQNLRANEKGFVALEGDEEDMDIEFMDMKASTTKNLMPSIQHHDRAILLNLLTQFLALGSTSMGSFALSADQSRLLILCLEAIANYIADNFNRYLVKKLVDYNFVTSVYPELKAGNIGSVDHNALTTSLQRATQSGFLTPQPEDENFVRQSMNMPPKVDEQPIDLAMYDDILSDLDQSMMQLTGELDPVPEEVAPEEMTDEELAQAAESIGFVYKAGPAGQPLSDETKRKISEALKKHHSSKGTKGKKKSDPEVTKRNKEIAKVRKEVKKLNDEARRELLKLKAEGKKLNPQQAAKRQLELMDKKNALTDKIDKLKAEIDERKAQTSTPTPSKTADDKVGATLDRINSILDANEKQS